MSATLSQLTTQYRQGRQAVKRLDAKIEKLREAAAELRTQQDALREELQESRIVIDFCIETGLSPVEAKLKYSLKEMQSFISQESYYSGTIKDPGHHHGYNNMVYNNSANSLQPHTFGGVNGATSLPVLTNNGLLGSIGAIGGAGSNSKP
jgi:hypothetical protein